VYPLAEDAAGRTITTHERQVDRIVRRIIRERMQTGRPELDLRGPVQLSAWEAFNGVQGYVQHDAPRRGRPNDFGRMIAALDDSAVRRAMELALSL